MSLFEHYKATPEAILGQRADALSDVQRLAGLKADIRSQHQKAHGSLIGILVGPIQTLLDPTYQKLEKISRLRLISSASLLQWATDVKSYNTGIDRLNAEYDAAAATSFGVDADRYFMHAATVPIERKQKLFDNAVAAAKSALLERLTKEKQKLDGQLDEQAAEAKAILDRQPTDETLNGLFQDGLLPLQISVLFPSIDVGKVDIGKLAANLKALGMLPPGADAGRIASLYRQMTNALFFAPGVDGALYQSLADLDAASPEELSLLFSLLTPEQIKAWDGRLKAAQDSPYLPSSGHWMRLDAYSDILSKISPDLVDKVLAAVPDLNPGFDHTDGYLAGTAPQRSGSTVGWHWGDPTGPLFAPDDDKDPTNNYLKIQQGGLADCWMITNMIASTLKHPTFPTDRVKPNANGTVTVTLYDTSGAAHQVTVTKQIVLDAQGGNALAHSSDGSTWATYYEKAMALAYADDRGGANSDDHNQSGNPEYDRPDNGNYAGLEWDYQGNASTYVTGNNYDQMDAKVEDVKAQFDTGHPVLVSTYSDKDTPPGEPSGYVNNHVFYVKALVDSDHDGQIDKVTLGNPWGGSPGSDVTCTPAEFEKFFAGAITLAVK